MVSRVEHSQQRTASIRKPIVANTTILVQSGYLECGGHGQPRCFVLEAIEKEAGFDE